MPSRILVIEDDASLAELEQTILQLEGYGAVIDDSLEALNRVARGEVDLVLLDLLLDTHRLPNGGALLPWLAARVPVIVVSAALDPDRAALELGARAVVHKPFSTRELLDAVKRVLAEKE